MRGFLKLILEAFESKNFNMLKYKKTVEYLANNDIDLIIDNGTYEHAAIIFEHIIGKADHCLSLLSQECNIDFYSIDKVSTAFLNYIDNTKGQGKIRIIVESSDKEEIENNVFINNLLNMYEKYKKASSLEVYVLKNINKLKIEDKIFHLLIADENGPYRFELCKEGKDGKCEHRKYISAIANFGNKDQSSNLWDIFEKQIAENSSRISFN